MREISTQSEGGESRMDNSRFKFRAWSKNVGMWGEVTDIGFRDGEIVHIRGLASYNGKSQQPIGGHADHMDITEINLMQYTGLHDKNGVEVYDGDIWQRGGFIAVVVFEHGQWVLNKAPSSSYYEYPSFWSNIDTGTVIGNIYENPELVES